MNMSITMTTREIFDKFKFIVHKMFTTDCFTDNLDQDNTWFTSQKLYFMCKGLMFPTTEHADNNDARKCSETASGWFFRGFCRIYGKSDFPYGREIYFGGWNNGSRCGYGFEEDYFGYFQDGFREGEGVAFKDNVIYMGNFRVDRFHGNGKTLTIEDGKLMETTQVWDNGTLVQNIKKERADYSLHELFHEYNMKRIRRNSSIGYFGNPTTPMCFHCKLTRCENPLTFQQALNLCIDVKTLIKN